MPGPPPLNVHMDVAEAMDALGRAVDEGRYAGYGPRPIPHALDALPQTLVGALRDAVDPLRESLQHLSPATADVLRVYAERQATLAVRRTSRGALERSLIALGFAAIAGGDVREALLVAPLPWHAAGLLGLNQGELLTDVAGHLPDGAYRFLLDFARRPAAQQSLACMGFIAGADGDGFRYQRTW